MPPVRGYGRHPRSSRWVGRDRLRSAWLGDRPVCKRPKGETVGDDDRVQPSGAGLDARPHPAIVVLFTHPRRTESMDEADREEIRAAHKDNAAIASVAIMGVVGICTELAKANFFTVPQVSRIHDFMVASIEGSGATESLQAHLHEALAHQFSALVAGLSPPDR